MFLQASFQKRGYTVLTSISDLVSFLSNRIGNICHEKSEGELIPSLCVCNSAPEWYMGESKLLTVVLPEEPGTAGHPASKLWLKYIQRTPEMYLCGLCSTDGLLIWLMLNVWIMKWTNI